MLIIKYVLDKNRVSTNYRLYQPMYNNKCRACNRAYTLPKLKPIMTPDINC